MKKFLIVFSLLALIVSSFSISLVHADSFYTITSVRTSPLSDPVGGSVAGGTTVVIRGIGFINGCIPMIGQIPLTDYIVKPTSITGITQPNSAGQYDVEVVCPNGGYVIYSQTYVYY